MVTFVSAPPLTTCSWYGVTQGAKNVKWVTFATEMTESGRKNQIEPIHSGVTERVETQSLHSCELFLNMNRYIMNLRV